MKKLLLILSLFLFVAAAACSTDWQFFLTSSVYPPVADHMVYPETLTTVDSEDSSFSPLRPTPVDPELLPFPDMTVVAKRTSRSENLVYNDFYRAGYLCHVVYEPNDTYAYGQVIRVEYNGFEDEANYYLTKDSSVTLYVSIAAGEAADTYNDRIIYLTFDDGPGKYTDDILAVLEQYNAKVTFFTIGTMMECFPKKTQAIYDAGHALACHSYDHVYANMYGSAEALTANIRKWEQVVTEITGEPLSYHLFRFPGGSTNRSIAKSNRPVLKDTLTALGYYGFDWNCTNSDKWIVGKGADESLSDFLHRKVQSTIASLEKKSTNPPRIFLCHETVPETVDMVAWMIEYLAEKGYTFRTLAEYNGSYYF